MNFGWDDAKNLANIQKHGFDFSDAWEVFTGPMAVSADTREEYGENRWIGFGILGNTVVAIAFAERGTDTIRIISMRRAKRHERLTYEEQIKD